jgi:thioredoxin 1
MSATSTLPIVTDDTFATEVGPGTGLVAVEFTADWCPPCRLMAPLLEEAAQDYAPRLRIVQLDADANPRTMTRLGVRGLPTLLVFRDGELAERVVGAVSRATLRQRLETVLAG